MGLGHVAVLNNKHFMVRLWIVVGFVWFEQCIHLGDELAEVFQAFPPDINQVLFQRC